MWPDQDGETEGAESTFIIERIKDTVHGNSPLWKQFGDWQKVSCTAKTVVKIHMESEGREERDPVRTDVEEVIFPEVDGLNGVQFIKILNHHYVGHLVW